MRLASLLTDLAACLKVTLEDAGVGDLCFIGVVPGDGVVQQYGFGCDDDKCGVAWVRLTTSYPATAVGITEVQPRGCATGLGFDIEVGVARCISAGDDQGNPPPEEEIIAYAQQQADDILLIRKAIACCASLPQKEYLLRGYQPVGPMGMLVGGAWTLAGVL